MSGTNYIASNWRTPTNQNSSKNDNYGLSFNGSSDFISCGNDPQIQLTGDISISAWFKTSDTNAMVIAAKRYNTLGDAYGWQVYCTTGGKIAFTVTRSGPTTTTATNPLGTNIADGEWHHVLCTINQDSQIAVILDGSTEATASLPAGTFIDSNSDLRIGKGTNLVGPPYYFNGEISEVALFDYLASGATLYGNATSGSGNPMALKPTPVGYWPLGDNSASDPLAQPNVAVEDASVFEFNGLDQGIQFENTWFAPKVPSSTDGNHNGSVSFWFKSANVSQYDGLIGFNCAFGLDNLRVLFDTSSGTFGAGANLRVTAYGSDNAGGETSMQAILYDSASTLYPGSSVDWQPDTWYHVAVVFDKNAVNRYIVYVDNVPYPVPHTLTSVNGMRLQSGTVPYSLPYTSGGSSAGNNCAIGCYYALNGTLYGEFEGNVFNLQTWETSLDSTNIETLYNDGVPLLTGTQPQEANLRSWHKLDQSANWEADTAGDWQIPDAVSEFPQSFDFSPADEYVDTGNNPLIGASNLSISAWFNSADVDSQYLLGDSSVRFSIKQSNGDTRITFTGSTDPFRGFGIPYNISEWNHLILTFDGSLDQADRLKLYHNGVEINNINAGTPNTTLLLNTAVSFMIGRVGGTSLNTWNGKISNVQLWDVTLDQPEVTTLYNSGTPTLTPPNQSDLKAWYKLDNTANYSSFTNYWSVYNDKTSAPTPTFTNAIRYLTGYYNPPGIYGGIGFTNTAWSSSDITISAWLRYPKGFDGAYGLELLRNSQINCIFDSNTSGKRFRVGTATAYKGFLTNITDGLWHHYLVYIPNGATTNVNDIRLWQDSIELSGSNVGSSYSTPITNIIGIGSGNQSGGGIRTTFNVSNYALFDTDQTSNIDTIFNNGVPGDISSLNPSIWYKADSPNVDFLVPNNTSVSFTDSSGNNNTGIGPIDTSAPTLEPYMETIDVVAREAATSTGLVEQSLVNNNVSTLNGESSGMTSGNLVLSDLTRNLPYENYSLSFDSGTDYVECGNISGLNGGLTEATWSGWFNRSSSGVFYIMGTYGTGQIQFFVLQGNDYVTAYAGNSVGAQRTMSKADVTPWTTGQWYHLTFVYDESESNDADKMKIYIDGVLQANAVAGSSLTSLNSSTASFDIGRLTGTASNQFDGKISNVAIWNNALSSTEVQNLYANGMPQDLTTFTPQPINWWTLGKESFWDGADWIIRDMIGTNDGVSANMGGNELKGDAPRSQANGVGTNIAVPTNLKGEAGWSDKNGYSINMSSTARTTDTP